MKSKHHSISIISACIFILWLFACETIERINKVETISVDNITANTANAKGVLVDKAGNDDDEIGFVYSLAPNPSFNSNKVSYYEIISTGDFNMSISGLAAGTKYYLRAYYSMGRIAYYGKEISFTTLQEVVPIISTSDVSNITSVSADCGGFISSDGGATVTARGVCYSTSQNPTIANSTTNNGTGTGNFTSSLAGLTANTTYYVRAYATNSAGTAYGSQISFTTSANINIPTVTTTTASSITQTTASTGGNVTSDGGASVIARGVCYSTSQNPTTANSTTSNGTGTGNFTSSLASLTANTTYYVRAYATNSAGTAYGSQISFTTSANINIPTVTTTTASSITQTTASTGGNVTSDGDASVTARGVCYSTSQNPTTANSTTSNGTGAGSFTSSLTGLTANTTYYVRAYATNSAGTAYGNQVSFITLTLPIVTTTAISAITATTATSGGNVTNAGNGTVTARGICWSTSQNPVVTSSHTSDGTGTGVFTSNLTGLSANTTYYVRAYATNAAGTAYGSQLEFKTNVSVTDYDGNVYNTVTIGTQTWMKENLKTTHYKDGTEIQLVTDAGTWNGLTTGAFCYYDNNTTNAATYGALYNWHTVNTGSLCPSGWHVPTDAEWTTLTDYLGGESVAGGKLKSITGWNLPNTGATNESGFSALPGGVRNYNGPFSAITTQGYWWSATEYDSFAWVRNLVSSNVKVNKYDMSFKYGFSVRCLRDY